MVASESRSARLSRGALRSATYWTTTLALATECLVGGVMGALQLSPFRDTAVALGYPTYFMSILGVWYVGAGLILLAPRAARLKEWAYAGLVINYTGAAASPSETGAASSSAGSSSSTPSSCSPTSMPDAIISAWRPSRTEPEIRSQ